jgi:hypothetical protein
MAMSLEDLYVRLVTREPSEENGKPETTQPEMNNGKVAEGSRGDQ